MEYHAKEFWDGELTTHDQESLMSALSIVLIGM